MILSNEDLYKKKYDYETLKTNIYVVHEHYFPVFEGRNSIFLNIFLYKA